MHFRNGLAAATALVCALALAPGLAQAQTPTTVQSKDATSTVFPIAGQRDSSGSFHYRDVMEGLAPSGAPDPFVTDGSGHFGALPLPTGAATQATLQQVVTALGAPFQSGGVIGNTGFAINGSLPAFASPPTVNLGSLNGAATAASQATSNGYLASLAGTVSGSSLTVACASGCGGSGVPTGAAGSPSTSVLSIQGVASGTAVKIDGSATTQPVSAAALPLPAGAATASKQDALLAAVGSPLQAGGNVAVTSSALPTGASTSAAQTTGNGYLATLAGAVSANTVTVTCASGCAGGGGSVPTGTAGSPNASVLSIQGIASATAVKVDGSAVTQPVSAAALPLPAGAATAAKQDALVTALGTPLQAGGNVVVTSSALPSGAATASGVSAIVTALGTPLQAGGNVAVTSSALPTGAATAAKQDTLLAALGSPVQAGAATAAGENHIGEVSQRAALPSGSFTTPAGTTAYAVGNLIANSATAGSVTPISLTACRVSGGTGMIRRIKVGFTDTAFAGALLRVHVYAVSPTVANGDHAAWSTTTSGYLGSFDVALDKTFTDGVFGIAAPSSGGEVNFACTGTTLYALLEARSAVTPTGSKVPTVTAEVLQN